MRNFEGSFYSFETIFTHCEGFSPFKKGKGSLETFSRNIKILNPRTLLICIEQVWVIFREIWNLKMWIFLKSIMSITVHPLFINSLTWTRYLTQIKSIWFRKNIIMFLQMLIISSSRSWADANKRWAKNRFWRITDLFQKPNH